MLATGAISRVKLKRRFCPARSSRSLGSSLQRNDAGVWLCKYPGLSFQRSPVRACSLVSSLLLRGYDEPAILAYAISSFCPTSADGLQRRERAADPLHYPDVTLKALVRGGELKVDDLGDLTYSVDRVLVLGPSQSFCAGRELVAMFPRCSSLQPQPGSRSAQRR